MSKDDIVRTDTLHAVMMGEVRQDLMMDLVRQLELRDEKIERLIYLSNGLKVQLRGICFNMCENCTSSIECTNIKLRL